MPLSVTINLGDTLVPLLTQPAWITLATGIQAIAQSLAIVAGAAWAFWRYVYQGEFKKRVGFTVEINFVATLQDSWLVELVAIVDNKGLVTQNITDFTFELRCSFPEDPICDAPRANQQIDIAHRLKKGSWLPPQWGTTFVRPGISNRYVYVTAVPRHACAVLLNGRFNYSNRDSFYTAVKLVDVPPSPPS